MRKRITFVHFSDSPFQRERFRVDNDTLRLESLKAAREERITFSYNELPQELWLVLKQCYELHIRWATQRPYSSEAPFVSRVSPGLHAFFTPSRNKSADNLCPLLRKVFGDELRCQSPESTFIAPAVLSDRFTSVSSLQLYQPLLSLSSLVAYIQQKICAPWDLTCRQYTSALLSADYLDVDYDSISHALMLNVFWSHAPSPTGWSENIRLDEGVTDKVEVGVLSQETSSDVEELKLGGFLTVVGEDVKPKPTLFSFPSRHHPLPSNPTFSTSFANPTGLHPVIHLTFPPSSLTPPQVPICFLHTYLTLPSALFADKYQLSDPLFLQSHNLRALRSIAGETDLEAPDWVVQRWGATLLLELLPTSLGNDDEVFTVSIPLHLRYLPPHPSGHRQIEVPYPVVFWACSAEEGTKMTVNPFDRVNLGYEGIFGPKTMFYHLSPSPSTNKTGPMGAGVGSLVETLRVPVLNMDVGAGESTGVGLVEFGTVLAIVAGFLWVCWYLFRALRQEGESSKTRDTRAKQKKDK